MIWEYTANLPRNLDIWALTIDAEMTFFSNQIDDPIDFIPFKFFSIHPVASILHANKES